MSQVCKLRNKPGARGSQSPERETGFPAGEAVISTQSLWSLPSVARCDLGRVQGGSPPGTASSTHAQNWSGLDWEVRFGRQGGGSGGIDTEASRPRSPPSCPDNPLPQCSLVFVLI